MMLLSRSQAIAAFVATTVILSWSPSAFATGKLTATEQETITRNLRSNDEALVTAACSQIKVWFSSDPLRAVPAFRRQWSSALLDGKHYAATAELSLAAAVARPFSAADMHFFLYTRARALLKLNKPQEALASVRSAFNVAPMVETSKIVLLIDECLRAANPTDAAKVSQQFRREQIAGVEATDEKSPPNISKTLLSLPLEKEAAEAALKNLNPRDRNYLLAKGNLELMAGRPQDARETFGHLLEESNATDLLPLYENIARTYRAEDGTIGWANAYLLSIPEEDIGVPNQPRR